MSDVLLYDVSGGIATITLNRPDSLNALNEEISLALQKAIADAAGDREVRCVVITGAGRAFTSGADLSDVDSLSEGGAKPDLGELLRPLLARLQRLFQISASCCANATTRSSCRSCRWRSRSSPP